MARPAHAAGAELRTQYLTLADPGRARVRRVAADVALGRRARRERARRRDRQREDLDRRPTARPAARAARHGSRPARARTRAARPTRHWTCSPRCSSATGRAASGEPHRDEPYFSSFLIADPDGGLVVETSKRTWAARPVGDRRGDLEPHQPRHRLDAWRPPTSRAGTDFDTYRWPRMPTAIADRPPRGDAARVVAARRRTTRRRPRATLRDHGRDRDRRRAAGRDRRRRQRLHRLHAPPRVALADDRVDDRGARATTAPAARLGRASGTRAASVYVPVLPGRGPARARARRRSGNASPALRDRVEAAPGRAGRGPGRARGRRSRAVGGGRRGAAPPAIRSRSTRSPAPPTRPSSGAASTRRLSQPTTVAAVRRIQGATDATVEFNLADLLERVADTVPDHLALVCAATPAHLRRARRPRQPARARARRARRRARATTSRCTSTTPPSTSKACSPRSSSARCRSTSTTATSRTSCAISSTTPTRSRSCSTASSRPSSPRSAPSLPRLHTFIAVDDGSDRDRRDVGLAADDYEARARRPHRRPRLRPTLRRRPVPPLHRRHHRHAQGRDVAPRRHLLRRDGRRGRRRARRSPRPRRSRSGAASRARAASRSARSCTAPRTGWRSARCSWAGPSSSRPSTASTRSRCGGSSSREQANFLVIVGDAFARPLLDALDRAEGRALDLSCLHVVLSGGAILSPTLKRAFVERLPGAAGRRRLRRVGDRRPGPVGRRRRRRGAHRAALPGRRRHAGARPRSPAASASASSAGSRVAATSRSATTRTREDRGDVPGRRRRALGGARRPRGRRGRRLDHAARSRFGLDQHRRREGLPRRGRVGAEGPRRRLRRGRRRRSRRPLGRAGRRRSCSRAPGATPGARRVAAAQPRRTSRATRSRARSCSSTRSNGRRRASPTTGGPGRSPTAPPGTVEA